MSSDQPLHSFSPQQIVCLEAAGDRLYGAVIQFIEPQSNYWLRPLCLVTELSNNPGRSPQIISLHRTSDIIVSQDFLREALDTEVLEFWTALYDESGDYEDNPSGRKDLQRFLHYLLAQAPGQQ